ncbi:MAG: tetratricopeptide repeat protein [Marinilabiliales bacterium]|nr:tetratricopeptide repeat protein [Marinilabiliales bacterium]
MPPAAESEYRANYAACCLELDRYTEAEEQLRRALQLAPARRIYQLTGDLASRYGDRYRAETAWRAGLELFPGDPDLLERLFRHRLYRGAVSEAEQTAQELRRADPARGDRALADLRNAVTVRYECAACGREWGPGRNFRPRPGRPSGPSPRRLPAGACPTCGKVYCVGCRKDHLEDAPLHLPGLRNLPEALGRAAALPGAREPGREARFPGRPIGRQGLPAPREPCLFPPRDTIPRRRPFGVRRRKTLP